MRNEPLADALRPRDFDTVVGQEHLFGERGVVRRMVESGRITELYDETGAPIESAPHPLMIFYARLPFAAAEGDILRAGDND